MFAVSDPDNTPKRQVFVAARLDSDGSSSMRSAAFSENVDSSHEGEQPTRKIFRRLHVQVVHRHGDRSPITSLKNEVYWEEQLIADTTLASIAANTVLISNNSEKNMHKANGRGPFGKLTMLGLQQMIDLGTKLREELSSDLASKETCYLDEVGNTVFPHIWTPDRPLHPSNLRVVSSMFERTVQSAQGVLTGLFRDGSEDAEAKTEIDTRHTTLLLPDPQPRQTEEQEKLEDKLAVSPHLIKREQELLPLAVRVTKALQPLLAADAREASFGAKQTRTVCFSSESIELEPLAWNQLGEITKCLACRNMLPTGLSQEDYEVVVQHAAWRWFEIFRHPRLAYLSMNDMCSKMVDDCMNHATEPPMILYSAHDSTLIGLLCAFKLQQPSLWPDYGSFLMMELLEVTDDIEKSETKEHYIRFSLNGELLNSHWEKEPSDMILLATLAEKLRHEGEATLGMTS